MRKKFIIFDCDGVLVNTEVISNGVIAEFLNANGYPISEEYCAKLFTGKSEQLVNQIILEKIGNSSIQQTDLSSLHQSILDTVTNDNSLKPLMSKVLEYLSEHNIDRCVASNSHRKWIIDCLETTDQLKFFDANKIYDVDKVLMPKPAPDLFLLAANSNSYPLEDCLVIEDSVTGVKAAKAAGIDVVGFLGSTHTKYEWYKDMIIDLKVSVVYNTSELLGLLHNIC